jgi:hypothetical protein
MAPDSRTSHLSVTGHRVLFRENQLGFPGAGGIRSRPVGRGLPVDESGNAQQQVAADLVSDHTAK